MHLIRVRDGVAVEEHLFRPGDLAWHERELLEDAGGRQWSTWEGFGVAFMGGSARARRAAMWVIARRSEPDLDFDTFTVADGDDLIVLLEDGEGRAVRQAIEELDDTSAEEKRALLAAIDQPRPAAEVVPDGPKSRRGGTVRAPSRAPRKRSAKHGSST
jgi:hypothetical protein